MTAVHDYQKMMYVGGGHLRMDSMDVASICLKCEAIRCSCGDISLPITASTAVRVPAGWTEQQVHTRVQQIQVLRPWVLPAPACVSDGPVRGSFVRPANRGAVPAQLDVTWWQGAYPITSNSAPPDPRLSHGWVQMRGRGVVRVHNALPLTDADRAILVTAIESMRQRIADALRSATLLWVTRELLVTAPGWAKATWQHPILVVPHGKDFAWMPGSSQKPLERAQNLSPLSDPPWTSEGNTWVLEGRLLPICRRDLLPHVLAAGPRVHQPEALARELAGWMVLP